MRDLSRRVPTCGFVRARVLDVLPTAKNIEDICNMTAGDLGATPLDIIEIVSGIAVACNLDVTLEDLSGPDVVLNDIVRAMVARSWRPSLPTT
jgi:hypothetical protein